jgi:ribosomal protein S18 acetylase RimI-like enzyme
LHPASTSDVEAAAVVVRRAEAADLEFVRALCRRVFLAYGSYHEYVASWFQDESVSTLVAETGGARAGFVMFTASGRSRTADLVAIAVSPELQSRGIGKALLSKCLEAFRESKEIDEVRLQVAEGNARAQRMFARSGFRLRPETGVYPAGQRALFMVKTLTPEVAR